MGIVNLQGGEIFYNGESYPLKHAFGSAASGLDRLMVAAVDDYKHRVIGLLASPGATGVAVTLKSAAVAITHAMESEGGQIQLPLSEHGYVETLEGEALNILAASGTTLWDVWYITIPAS